MSKDTLRRDIVVNTAFAFLNVLTYMWVIREAGALLLPASLGLLLLARRMADSVSNLLQLGSAQTLRRYIPMAMEPSRQLAYIAVNLVIFAITSVLFSAIALSGLSSWTQVLFPGGQAEDELTLVLALSCIATVLGFIASSSLLAFRHIKATNIVEIANTSGWLLVVMWIEKDHTTVEKLVLFQSLGTLVTSSAVLLVIVLQLRAAASLVLALGECRTALRETIAYGFPRSFTPFLDASLVLLGPWLLRADAKEAGYLIIAFTFLRIGRMMVQPAGLVIGVAIARQLSEDDPIKLQRRISLFFGGVVYVSVFVASLLLPWTSLVLEVWLGNAAMAQQVGPYAVAILLAMPPLAIAQALKEPIEMMWRKPVYVGTLIGSIGLLFIWFEVTNRLLGAGISVVSGYILVYWSGCTVSVYLLRRHIQGPGYYTNIRLVGLTILTFAWNLGVSIATEHATIPQKSLAAVCAAVVSVGLMSWYLRRVKSIEFFTELRNRLPVRIEKTPSR